MKTEGFTAHFLGIGDELLNGRVFDRNGPWLGEFLGKKGLQLESLEITPDREETIHRHIRELWQTPNPGAKGKLIILSGGLGPTPDDITKNTMAKAFDSPLKAREDVKELVKEHYQRKNLDWTPETNSYHLFPESFTPLSNPTGLAPGLLKVDAKRGMVFASLPGVPREFRSMVQELFQRNDVTKALKIPSLEESPETTFCIRTRFCPEEKIFGELVPDLWQKLEEFGKVSSLPQMFGVDLYVTLSQESTEKLKETRARVRNMIMQTPLAPHVWQFGQMSLPELIIHEAREKNIRLGLAESCTGGMVAHWLTNVSGSSQVFQGSVVSYANDVKERLLNVQNKSLKEYGAVSVETAREMAQGAMENLSADLCVSFTGIAGPTGGSEKKPVGSVAIGLAQKGKESSSKWFEFKGDRQQLKQRFALRGLHWMLDALREA